MKKDTNINLRDLAALAWIGKHAAADYEQIARLLRPSCPLAMRTVRYHTSRWERAGLVKRQKVEAGRPVVVWLTRKGQKLINEEHPLGAALAERSLDDILADGWRDLAKAEVGDDR